MSDNTGPFGAPRGTLDAAIDRAVRRMMAVEPRPGLRHRVLARLKTTEAPARGFLPRFAFAAAALAIVILGVSMLRRPVVPVDAPSPSTAAATAPAAPEAESLPPVRPQGESVTAPPATARPRLERLPEPPQMAEVFGTPDLRVAATSVSRGPLDDPRTPYTEPGATFRSPIAGLPPLRLEDLGIPLVQVKPPGINPQ